DSRRARAPRDDAGGAGAEPGDARRGRGTKSSLEVARPARRAIAGRAARAPARTARRQGSGRAGHGDALMRAGRRNRPGGAGRRAPRFIIITGMSGAGKSQAIRALEDLGFYCVDNLPITLIPSFAD